MNLGSASLGYAGNESPPVLSNCAIRRLHPSTHGRVFFLTVDECNRDLSTANQVPSMLIARAAMAMMVTREIMLSAIINNLAREVSGMTSVGLNAVAFVNDV